MYSVKTISIKALALALLCSGILGCANTPPAPTPTSCSIPTLASLPEIQASQLSTLDDSTYWALAEREKRISDWALEMRVILNELCGNDAADGV